MLAAAWCCAVLCCALVYSNVLQQEQGATEAFYLFACGWAIRNAASMRGCLWLSAVLWQGLPGLQSSLQRLT